MEITIFTHFQSFFFHFKNVSVPNTDPANAYIKFEINWVITFPDTGTETLYGRTHGHTDACSAFLCPLPTSSVWTMNGSYFLVQTVLWIDIS